MPAYAPPKQKPLGPAAQFPFNRWVAGLIARDEARLHRSNEMTDFLLDDSGMKQFAIGEETGSIFVIGSIAADLAAIVSVPWTSAALVRGHEGRDWVAIAAKDVRLKGAQEMNAVPYRLWLPMPATKMDIFMETRPARLRMREVTVVKGLPKLPNIKAPPALEVPLAMKGKW